MKLVTLLVEDDEGLRTSLARSFARRGHEVVATSSVAEAVGHLTRRRMDLVLLDMQLPDGSGLDVLSTARASDSQSAVIVMTAFPDVKLAVRAMKEGAQDFIVKPFDLEELHLIVERALETRELRRCVDRFEQERRSRDDVTEILGESAPIANVREQISRVAPADTPVLIVGETGTGKELVADSIHRQSARSDGPFVKVNCSAFSEQLMESELFGHERGAFTDAREARAGLFEMADGGTLFLDEIAEMSPALQSKFLRVVEGQPFRRVGGTREIRTDVRVVAATNRDLAARVRGGEFREDLFYRLGAFQIVVPPLRVRGADVLMLANFFLRRSAIALRKGPLRFRPEVEEMLSGYDWPGNVRELKNVMERAAILSDSEEVGVQQLPAQHQASAFVRRQAGSSSGTMPTLQEIEQRYMLEVVGRVQGNLSEAARILGIARNTLKSRLRIQEAE
ncbi:MAG: sigma-54-dependent Fis family transcriptional regulator [Planctomycetes bacterium]|nr:sigma-54-dependent Fis family transcriptional regulator [Planctomycetota bacterium]